MAKTKISVSGINKAEKKKITKDNIELNKIKKGKTQKNKIDKDKTQKDIIEKKETGKKKITKRDTHKSSSVAPADVLIISSDYTGHGHKSIAEALTEQFEEHYPSTAAVVIDGFSLAGSIGTGISKLYGTVTRTASDLWRFIWELSSKKPSLFIDFCEVAIEDDLVKLIKGMEPKVIVSVHPYFNAPVINILRKYGIKIPFITIVADLISISSLWADRRADYIICPTPEAAVKCTEYGVSEDKLRILGFPVRKKFQLTSPSQSSSCISAPDVNNHSYVNTNVINYSNDNSNASTDANGTPNSAVNTDAKTDAAIASDISSNTKSGSLPGLIRFLIMSGGEGVANISRITGMIRTLLKNYNCTITIVAGRNKILKSSLELAAGDKYSSRLTVIGFTKNIHELMIESDIIFARGSPNTVMEAIHCNKPVIITGALPGQEAENPLYVARHGLGLICRERGMIKPIIDALLRDRCSLYEKIKESQRQYMQPDSSRKIVSFIAETAGIVK